MHKVLITFTFLFRYRQYSNYDFFRESLAPQIFCRYVCIFNGVMQQCHDFCPWFFASLRHPYRVHHIVTSRFILLPLMRTNGSPQSKVVQFAPILHGQYLHLMGIGIEMNAIIFQELSKRVAAETFFHCLEQIIKCFYVERSH